MKIKKAVDRLFWRFGGNDDPKKPKPNTTFPINENDAEAYTAIKDYVSQEEKRQYQNNEMFAKMYIFIYGKILENDKTTVFDTEPRKKMHSFLSKPLYQIIEDFTKKLNEAEQYELLESIQGEIKHPALVSEEEKVSNAEKLQEAIREPENKSKLLGEVWEYDLVKECLEAEINEALKV